MASSRVFLERAHRSRHFKSGAILQNSPFKNDILKGKVVLITGGGSGINFGVAKALASHGADIAIMGRREEVLKAACEELGKLGVRTHYRSGDVRDPEACEAVVKSTADALGRIDILVNGAAGNFLCPPEMLIPNGFKTVIDIDLNGTFNMCPTLSGLMRMKFGIFDISVG
jgi:peroxisomal 2,4-dienoyl-CoA reductase